MAAHRWKSAGREATAWTPSAASTAWAPAPGPGHETLIAIDVECVATGPQHHDRAVAQISLVDAQCNPILNLYVRPDKPVVSYLTPLTGMTQEHLDAQGTDFASAVQTLRSQLPPSSVLVGQNILKDVEWLGLVRGTDFADMVDLSALLRCWNSRFNSYSYFYIH